MPNKSEENILKDYQSVQKQNIQSKAIPKNQKRDTKFL